MLCNYCKALLYLYHTYLCIFTCLYVYYYTISTQKRRRIFCLKFPIWFNIFYAFDSADFSAKNFKNLDFYGCLQMYLNFSLRSFGVILGFFKHHIRDRRPRKHIKISNTQNQIYLCFAAIVKQLL